MGIPRSITIVGDCAINNNDDSARSSPSCRSSKSTNSASSSRKHSSRSSRSLASYTKYGTIPDEYVCPLSKLVMNDPVIAPSGRSFERAAVLQWLKHSDHCPLESNEPLKSSDLAANHPLQVRISIWRELNNVPDDDCVLYHRKPIPHCENLSPISGPKTTIPRSKSGRQRTKGAHAA